MACRDENIATLRRWLPAPLLGVLPWHPEPDARGVQLDLPETWQGKDGHELAE
jgi:dethiobiotin synthetase